MKDPLLKNVFYRTAEDVWTINPKIITLIEAEEVSSRVRCVRPHGRSLKQISMAWPCVILQEIHHSTKPSKQNMRVPKSNIFTKRSINPLVQHLFKVGYGARPGMKKAFHCVLVVQANQKTFMG